MRLWHQGFIDLDAAPGYREALERHYRALLRPGATVTINGMPAGAFADSTPAEAARHAYLAFLHTNHIIDSVVRGEMTGHDAAIIAIIQNPGLAAARTLVDIPVVGYGEAAMHLACQLGRRFAVLAFNADLFDLLAANLRETGLEARAAPFTLIDADYAAVARGFDDPAPLVAAFLDAARRAIATGADVLIPGQMIFAEILWQQGIQRVDGVPVVDGLGACIVIAQGLVDLRRVSGVSHTRRGYFGARPPAGLVAAARARYLRETANDPGP